MFNSWTPPLWCSILSNLYYFKLILNNIFRLHETLIYSSNILLSSDCHLLQNGLVSCFLGWAFRNFFEHSQVILFCTMYFIFAHTLTITTKRKRRRADALVFVIMKLQGTHLENSRKSKPVLKHLLYLASKNFN